MRHILIAGCGFVGCELARQLLSSGHEVWALRRDVSKLPAELCAQERFHAVSADLSQPLSSKVLPASLSHVVYAASAGARTEQAYENAYPTGLNHILQLPQVLAPAFQHLVFVSSTAVYAQDDGSWVNETSPAEPQSFSGRILRKAEQLLTNSTVPGTVLRCSGIYGPGRTRLIDKVRAEGPVPMASHPHFTNRIHRDDVAGVCAWLFDVKDTPPLLLGNDEAPVLEGELYGWLSGRIFPKSDEGAPALPNPSLATPPTGKRCSSRLLQSLGYQLRYPTFKEGYAQMLSASGSQ